MSNKMRSVAALALTLAMLLTMMPAAMADSAVYVLHLKPAPTATPKRRQRKPLQRRPPWSPAPLPKP